MNRVHVVNANISGVNSRLYCPNQWRNRRGGGGRAGDRGAECPPETYDRETFADASGKKRQGKKGKWVTLEKKRRKIVKGKVEKKLEMEVGKFIKSGEELFFFFFFFFFFFCFSLLKTTKTCFGSTKMGIFYREKHFTPGRKSEKWICPLRKICLLRPWPEHLIFTSFRTDWNAEMFYSI